MSLHGEDKFLEDLKRELPADSFEDAGGKASFLQKCTVTQHNFFLLPTETVVVLTSPLPLARRWLAVIVQNGSIFITKCIHYWLASTPE